MVFCPAPKSVDLDVRTLSDKAASTTARGQVSLFLCPVQIVFQHRADRGISRSLSDGKEFQIRKPKPTPT